MTSARADSRYLATSPITTDLSQRLTNLTASGAGGYETNSARTAISGSGAGRSIELKCVMDNASAGVLVDHENGAGYRIRVSAGGSVAFSNSSGTLKTLVAPSIAVGNQDYVIAWSTEPNPLTTGASNAHRSEFLIWGGAAGAETLVWDTAEHAVGPVSDTATFTVGGAFTGGVLTLPYNETIYSVRISCRFHTRVETREHFVAQTAAPSITGLAACQFVVPPTEIFEESGLGFHIGPQYQAAAASMQTTRDRHRLLSYVWHWDCLTNSTTGFSDDMRTTVGSKHVVDHGAGWQTPLCWVARRRIPPHVQWLRVRVQWATWETVPGVTDKVELRFHTSDGPLANYTTESHKLIDRTADDTSSGAGVNQVFDFVRVNRAPNGYTYLWMSGRTDEGSGSGNATYQVRSVDAMPVVLPNGYDGIPANPWD